MKNKELTELINKMKKCYGVMDYYLAYNEVDLLLNYIEQLENNRDKAIEYVKEFRFATVKFEQHSDTLLNILKGGSDD